MYLLSPTEGVDPAVLWDQPTFLCLSVHHSQNPRGFAERVPPVMNRGCRYRLLISLDIIKPNRLISLLCNLRLAEGLGAAMPKKVPPGPAAGLEFEPPLLCPPGSPEKMHKTKYFLLNQQTFERGGFHISPLVQNTPSSHLQVRGSLQQIVSELSKFELGDLKLCHRSDSDREGLGRLVMVWRMNAPAHSLLGHNWPKHMCT